MKRESWWKAYIVDINPEERQKGKTVEVGKVFFQTKMRRFTILDAPGHEKYVPNMIEGAAQADVAALVISARDGEFEAGFERGGQTREHAHLVKSFGVDTLVVLINKMDEPSVNWGQERYNHIRDQVSPFLDQDCGYDMKKVFWIPISGLSGANLRYKVDEKLCPWYGGPALLDLFDQVPLPDR